MSPVPILLTALTVVRPGVTIVAGFAELSRPLTSFTTPAELLRELSQLRLNCSANGRGFRPGPLFHETQTRSAGRCFRPEAFFRETQTRSAGRSGHYAGRSGSKNVS